MKKQAYRLINNLTFCIDIVIIIIRKFANVIHFNKLSFIKEAVKCNVLELIKNQTNAQHK